MAWWCGALVTAGCFTGSFLSGRPCASDSECGPQLKCEQGVCGGPVAGSSTGTSIASSTGTADPGTSSLPTTGEPGTGETTTSSTTAAASTTTTVATDTGTSEGTDTSTGVDPCATATCQQVDLLVIVDDSPSIAQWQPTLHDALTALAGGPAGALLRDSCDLHVGVLSTGEPYLDNPAQCQGLGALVRVGAADCGAAFATEADDLGLALGCRTAVGATGSKDERPVQALLSALTPERNGPGGCNDGFLRPDALLVIVLATDEDDDADLDDERPGAETPGTPQEWFNAVVAFKGSAERVVVLALLGDLEPVTLCPWKADAKDGTGAEYPARLRQFIDLFPRNAVASICQPDYDDFVGEVAGNELAAACEARAQGTR